MACLWHTMECVILWLTFGFYLEKTHTAIVMCGSPHLSPINNAIGCFVSFPYSYWWITEILKMYFPLRFLFQPPLKKKR